MSLTPLAMVTVRRAVVTGCTAVGLAVGLYNGAVTAGSAVREYRRTHPGDYVCGQFYNPYLFGGSVLGIAAGCGLGRVLASLLTDLTA